MKINKKVLSILIVLFLIVAIYAFFHIRGKEIRYIHQLSEAETVSVSIIDRFSEQQWEIELNKQQAQSIQKLLKESSYRRRLSSSIEGGLPDKTYHIFADLDEKGNQHLYITVYGGEYIQFLNQYGSKYHKILNPNFEEELTRIFEVN